ncbi:MAG: DUF4440 domain-containing protein [Proteobacteria bacterium]|nr:DUF4440 domain-containing protein [Pseudomonadota bacterium]
MSKHSASLSGVLIAVCMLSALGASSAGAKGRHARAGQCPNIVDRPLSRGDVACALDRWYRATNAHDPAATTALYAAQNPLLLSTLKPAPFTNRTQIRTYFDGLLRETDFRVVAGTRYPNKVDLGREMAAESGFYTFSWVDDTGRPVVAPSRFTFVFVLNRATHQLDIATHHSSKEP